MSVHICSMSIWFVYICVMYICVYSMYMYVSSICVYRKRNTGVEDVCLSVCIYTFMCKRGYIYHIHMFCLYVYHADMHTEADKWRLPVFYLFLYLCYKYIGTRTNT